MESVLFNNRLPPIGWRARARAWAGAGMKARLGGAFLRAMQPAAEWCARVFEGGRERMVARSFGAMSLHQLSDIVGRDLAMASSRHRVTPGTERWRVGLPRPM